MTRQGVRGPRQAMRMRADGSCRLQHVDASGAARRESAAGAHGAARTQVLKSMSVPRPAAPARTRASAAAARRQVYLTLHVSAR
jgi:hypothetical protein